MKKIFIALFIAVSVSSWSFAEEPKAAAPEAAKVVSAEPAAKKVETKAAKAKKGAVVTKKAAVKAKK